MNKERHVCARRRVGEAAGLDGLVSDRTHFFIFPPISLLAGVLFIIQGQGWEALGALSERRWVTALAELQRLP